MANAGLKLLTVTILLATGLVSFISKSAEPETLRIEATTEHKLVGTWLKPHKIYNTQVYEIHTEAGKIYLNKYVWDETNDKLKPLTSTGLKEISKEGNYLYVSPELSGEKDLEEEVRIDAVTGKLLYRHYLLGRDTLIRLESKEVFERNTVQYLNTCRANDTLTIGRYVLPDYFWSKLKGYYFVRLFTTPKGNTELDFYTPNGLVYNSALTEMPLEADTVYHLKNSNGRNDVFTALRKYRLSKQGALGAYMIELGTSQLTGYPTKDIYFFNDEGEPLGSASHLNTYGYKMSVLDSVFYH